MEGDDDHEPVFTGDDTIEETYGVLASVLDDVSSVMCGTLLAGRYEVLERIGEGGMAAIYRVMDIQLGEEAALKLLAADVGGETLRRFRDEVRLARRVTHPNVVRTHDIGEHRGRPFLTMELVRGESLADLLAREGALPPKRAATIAAQIAAGLAASHEAGVLHRDLKPSNVMITGRGRVVLTDFGIARALDLGAAPVEEDVDGTPLYMSPEQVSGLPEDPRSEVYTLGIILFEMLTGVPPFTTSSYAATAAERLRSTPPDPRRLAPVPDPLATLTMACMAGEPSERPRTAAEAEARLEGWIGSCEPSTGRTPLPSTPLFAPALAGCTRSLAVLPLRYAGPPEHEYLGDAMTEELIDVLARTRSLRVLAYGATRHLRGELDAGEVHTAFAGRGDAGVDGEVRLAGPELRVSIRLLAASSGAQTWAGTFDAELTEVQGLKESMARRIGEALRVEVHGAPQLDPVPAEAVDSLATALGIAPTCAEAHQALGRLQAEAGRAAYHQRIGELLTEAHCHRGDSRRALRSLRRAADEALVEVHWLGRCPGLEPIRLHPKLRRCADLVLARAAAIWRQ